MPKEDKTKFLENITTVTKEVVFIFGLLFTLVGYWFKLNANISDTQKLVIELSNDTAKIQEKVDSINELTNANSTDIKVIQTQIDILRGKQ